MIAITADTVTVEKLREIAGSLKLASDQMRELFGLASLGEVTPEEAARIANVILQSIKP